MKKKQMLGKSIHVERGYKRLTSTAEVKYRLISVASPKSVIIISLPASREKNHITFFSSCREIGNSLSLSMPSLKYPHVSSFSSQIVDIDAPRKLTCKNSNPHDLSSSCQPLVLMFQGFASVIVHRKDIKTVRVCIY